MSIDRYDIFISHSSIDSDIAFLLCDALEKQDIKCWIAPRDVKIGLPFAESIVEGIENSKALVVLFSANTNQSGGVLKELEVANRRNMPIMPLRIEDVFPTRAMEYYIVSNHWTDVINPKSVSDFQEFVINIKNNFTDTDMLEEVFLSYSEEKDKISLLNFIKNNAKSIKKTTMLILLIFLFGIGLFVFAIIGEPNQKKWKNEIFPKHIAQIATKVYDNQNHMIGGLSNKRLKETNNQIFYVETVPPLFWNILKFREEKYLGFNGIPSLGFFSGVIKGRGRSLISQQLVKNFYGQYYFNSQTNFHILNTIFRKWTELNEAKTFYYNLRANNGEEFKRWISMYLPSFVSNENIYGIENISAIVFGKKPKDLTDSEQIILSEMYKYSYYFFGKVNYKRCKLIKMGAKIDIANYFRGKDKKIEELNQEIDDWICPRVPKVPFAFYKNMHPNNRIWEWASTSASTLKNELNAYREEYRNRLIIEAKMSIDVPKNIKFKNGINSAFEKIEKRLGNRLYVNLDGDKKDNNPQANIWVSVVNKNGEIKYIYKRGNTNSQRRIGSVSKVFEAIALGNRGDKYNYFYCNEAFQGLHNFDGNTGGECKNNSNYNIYEAKNVFGASKNLPMKSALEKYVLKDITGIRIVEDRVSDKKLKQIYSSFNLSRDTNKNAMRYELSFGMTNSSPMNLQKSIHKLTHLLYSKEMYREVHITKSIKYKRIKNSTLQKGGETTIYKTDISKETRKLFNANTKTYMTTLLKSALNPQYGTLKSFNNIPNFDLIFMQEGTTNKVIDKKIRTQSKWLTGAIKVKGETYSFVIMVHHKNGIGENVKHDEITKPIFREIIKALNR